MSVPNQTPYIIYNANGLTTVFPFEFYIINAGDIQVSINGTTVTSGYSVSGTGNVGGGDVTFITPPASGSIVMLERVVPTYRLTDYQDNGDLLADTVNKDFDRLWMAIQRSFIYLGLALRRPLLGGPFNAEGYRIEKLADPLNAQDAATKNYVDNVSLVRALRVPESYVPVLPPVSQRANRLLAFNDSGSPIVVLPASGSASDVMIELAKPTGAEKIGYKNGTVASYLDLMDVYLESYLLPTDTTINRAFNYICSIYPNGARVIFPRGKSLFAECLNNKMYVPSNYELHGNGCVITAFKDGVNNVESIFTIAKGLTDASFTPSNNVYIHDFILDGNFSLSDNRALFRNQSLIGVARAPGSSAATETLVSRNVRIERMQFRNCAWGLSVNAIVNFDLAKCYFEGLIYTGDDGVTTVNVSGGYGINIGNCRNVNIHDIDAKATTGAERHLIYITAGNFSVSIKGIHVDWALAGSTRGTGTCPPINIRAVNRLIIDGYQVVASSTYTNCFISFNGDSGVSNDITIINVEATGAKDDGIVLDNVMRFNLNNLLLTDVSSPSTISGSTGIRLQLAQQGSLDNILIQGSNLNSGLTIRSGCDKITTGDNVEIRNTNKLAGITYRGFVFATHTISYSPGSEYSGLPSTNIRIGRIRWSGLDYTFYDTTASLYAGKVALTHPAIGVMKVVAGVITEVQDSYGILSWGQHSAGASVIVSQYFPADMNDYGVSLTVQDTVGNIRSAFAAMVDASAKRWVISMRTSGDAYVDATTQNGLRIVLQVHQLGGL